MQRLLFCLLVLSSQMVLAAGQYFEVTSSANAVTLRTTIPNHVYANAGIKAEAPYRLACTASSNGYCLFSVSDKNTATFQITGPSTTSTGYATIRLTLCLNGRGPLSCQDYHQAIPIEATLSVTGSPLSLTASSTSVAATSGSLTITNTSTFGITATNITSYFQGTALENNVTQTSSTCSSVAPGSSCTLTYTAGSQAVSQTNFIIRGQNTFAAEAAISIAAGVDPIGFLYVLPSSLHPTMCPILSDGSLSTCTSLTSVSSYVSMSTYTVGTPAVTYAYFPQTGLSAINQCTLNTTTGALTNCTPLSIYNTAPYTIAFNSATNYAYYSFSGTGSSYIAYCPVNTSDGTFGSCNTTTGTGLTYPYYIAINANYLYAINFGSASDIIICGLSSSGGIISCTTATDSSFNYPGQISFRNNGTLAYITNTGNNTISNCAVSSSGTLSGCTTTGTSVPLAFDFVTGIYNQSVTNNPWANAYILNSANSTVAICPFTNNTTFGTCTSSDGNGLFTSPLMAFVQAV